MKPDQSLATIEHLNPLRNLKKNAVAQLNRTDASSSIQRYGGDPSIYFFSGVSLCLFILGLSALHCLFELSPKVSFLPLMFLGSPGRILCTSIEIKMFSISHLVYGRLRLLALLVVGVGIQS